MKLAAGIALVISLPLAGAVCAQEYDFGIAAKQQQMRSSPVELHISLANSALNVCPEAVTMTKTLEDMRRSHTAVSDGEWEQADYNRCADLFKEAIKQSSQQAAKSLKTKGGKEALKEHTVLALTALQGVLPSPDESTKERASQTATAKRDLQKQQLRLEAAIN